MTNFFGLRKPSQSSTRYAHHAFFALEHLEQHVDLSALVWCSPTVGSCVCLAWALRYLVPMNFFLILVNSGAAGRWLGALTRWKFCRGDVTIGQPVVERHDANGSFLGVQILHWSRRQFDISVASWSVHAYPRQQKTPVDTWPCPQSQNLRQQMPDEESGHGRGGEEGWGFIMIKFGG